MIMTTLLQHIESLNAQAQAWMDANPGDWCSKYTDDMSYWYDMGIFTVEDFKRNQLINGISDASKDLMVAVCVSTGTKCLSKTWSVHTTIFVVSSTSSLRWS